MNHSLIAVWMLYWIGIGCASTKPALQLLPGVTLEQVPFQLSGRLVFVAPWDTRTQHATNAGFLYEVKLQDMSLHQIVSAPGSGILLSSKDGQTFCILYGWTSTREMQQFTNGFLYSARKKQSRVVDLTKLPDLPSRSVVIDDVLAFRQTPGEAVYVYGLEQGEPRAGNWAELSRDQWRELHGYKDANGRYVYFGDGSSCIFGYTLVSSEKNWFDTKHLGHDPTFKILHRFSKFRGNDFLLLGLSPCRRYAFVRFSEFINTQTGPAEVRSYFAVKTDSGETCLLLSDAFARKGLGHLSEVYWVSEATPNEEKR